MSPPKSRALRYLWIALSAFGDAADLLNQTRIEMAQSGQGWDWQSGEQGNELRDRYYRSFHLLAAAEYAGLSTTRLKDRYLAKQLMGPADSLASVVTSERGDSTWDARVEFVRAEIAALR